MGKERLKEKQRQNCNYAVIVLCILSTWVCSWRQRIVLPPKVSPPREPQCIIMEITDSNNVAEIKLHHAKQTDIQLTLVPLYMHEDDGD